MMMIYLDYFPTIFNTPISCTEMSVLGRQLSSDIFALRDAYVTLTYIKLTHPH